MECINLDKKYPIDGIASQSEDQHGVAERIEAIASLDGSLVCVQDSVTTGKCADHHEQG